MVFYLISCQKMSKKNDFYRFFLLPSGLEVLDRLYIFVGFDVKKVINLYFDSVKRAKFVNDLRNLL